jgi:hypothetical protein
MASISYVVRKQEFTITVNGLMPSTVHYLYFEGKKQASTKIKPRDKDLGGSLTTNENGYVQFTYFFDGDVPDTSTVFEDALKSSMLKGGLKSYTVTNYDFGDDLPDDYTSRCKSYATGTLDIVLDTENVIRYV